MSVTQVTGTSTQVAVTSQPTVRQQLSVDISTEISAEFRLRYQPISWLIFRLICRPTHLDRYIGRVSVDMSTDISIEHRPTLNRYVGQYIGQGVHKIHMIQTI